MASVRSRGGKFRVTIRRKGVTLCSTFKDRDTADLWVRYKEDLIDDMHAFQAPKKELITLGDAYDMKIEDITGEKNFKTIADYKSTKNHLEPWLDKPLSFFTYEFFMDLLKEWESSKILHGGWNTKEEDRKNYKTPSPHTILRRFAYTSSVFSFIIEKGIDVDNNAQKVTTFLRQRMKGKI